MPGVDYGSSELGARDAKFFGDRLHRFAPDVPGNGAIEVAKIRAFIQSALALRFFKRPQLQASTDHPSRDGVPTDAELYTNLLAAMPGFVELDCLVDVKIDTFEGHIFDLTTTSRWYIADGIVTHNCVCADTGHALMLRTANASGSIVVPSDADIEKLYEVVGGFDPSDPQDTDNGCDETTMCEYLEKTGFLGHKSDATGTVEPSNLDHLRWCVQLFGTCRLGVNLPQSAVDAFNNSGGSQAWDVGGDETIVGGHDVPLVGYKGDSFLCVTWGVVQPMTGEFILKFVEEVHSELFPDWIAQQGTAPSGFDLQDLLARLGECT